MRVYRSLKMIAAGWLQAGFVAAVILGMAAAASPANADPINLVQNGDFSQTALSGNGGFLCANTGGNSCTSQVSNWAGTCATYGCTGTSTPTSVMFAGTNGAAWNGGFGLYWSGIGDAPLGGSALGVDGDTTYTSVITQAVAGLQLGHSYVLQFYQAASQQVGLSGATTEQWKVNLGGGTSQISTLMNTPSKGAHGWMVQTMTFVATAVSETLQFVALGTPGGEPPVVLLGDVSLVDAGNVAVPEPATIALVGGGLLVLAIGRKRAQRA